MNPVLRGDAQTPNPGPNAWLVAAVGGAVAFTLLVWGLWLSAPRLILSWPLPVASLGVTACAAVLFARIARAAPGWKVPRPRTAVAALCLFSAGLGLLLFPGPDLLFAAGAGLAVCATGFGVLLWSLAGVRRHRSDALTAMLLLLAMAVVLVFRQPIIAAGIGARFRMVEGRYLELIQSGEGAREGHDAFEMYLEPDWPGRAVFAWWWAFDAAYAILYDPTLLADAGYDYPTLGPFGPGIYDCVSMHEAFFFCVFD